MRRTCAGWSRLAPVNQLPLSLQKKLDARASAGSLRSLGKAVDGLVDFSSNDYLGLGREAVAIRAPLGSGGSRLLTGNHEGFEPLERLLSRFHKSEDALVMNSGYAANLALLQAIPQRGDVVFYDSLSHASMRDGLQLSHARSVRFQHNDLQDLNACIERERQNCTGRMYVLTESVFSMDGDSPDLAGLVALAQKMNVRILLDEAHAVGVVGALGAGLAAHLGLEDAIFARVVTFGKAIGGHGAAILGSSELKTYLINFARPFIYSTALPLAATQHVMNSYTRLQQEPGRVEQLGEVVSRFRESVQKHNLHHYFIPSTTAIHCCVIPGNEQVSLAAHLLQEAGHDVRPIKSPTVTAGRERLRFCLHSYNTASQIDGVLAALQVFLQS